MRYCKACAEVNDLPVLGVKKTAPGECEVCDEFGPNLFDVPREDLPNKGVDLKPKARPDVPPELSIKFLPGGRVEVNGPIDNPVLFMGMLGFGLLKVLERSLTPGMVQQVFAALHAQAKENQAGAFDATGVRGGRKGGAKA